MKGNGYLTATSIGHVANEILQTKTEANGWGNTSKGFFAITDNKKVLFISHQPFKGPFTINTNGEFPALQTLSHDSHLLLSPYKIKFIQPDLEVRISPETTVWCPPITNKLDFDLESFIIRGNLIKQKMITHFSNQDQAHSAGVNEKQRLTNKNRITIFQ